MEKIFIAGSRKLARLSKEVKKRIDKIIAKGFTVVVGDANGADKAVQQYLANKHYENVIVHCMAGMCRNNLGNWTIREINAAPGATGFHYYSAKDRFMAEEADYGLMLWDGKSRGTFANIEDLVRQEKPVVIYLAPEKSFITLRKPDEATLLLKSLHPAWNHRAIGRQHARTFHPRPDVLF